MSSPNLPSPADLARWRVQLAAGGPLSAADVRLLLDAVEQLQVAVRSAEQDAFALAAVYLGRRLSALPTNGGRCPSCGDGEAHAAAAWLRRAAGSTAEPPAAASRQLLP